MDEEKEYYVKFEMSYGVHHGIPGFPITETKEVTLNLFPDDDPYKETANYLVDSGFFSTESGYLEAKVFEIGNSEKSLKQNVLVKVSSLELIIVREIREKKVKNNE